MADLKALFKRAGSELPNVRLRKARTQEVLELTGVQGIAWRPLSDTQVLQIYPPTRGRKTSRDGEFLVVMDAKSEWRYHDPDSKLNPRQWNFVGCNCSTLPDDQVWGWIRQAYEYLRRDKLTLAKGQTVPKRVVSMTNTGTFSGGFGSPTKEELLERQQLPQDVTDSRQSTGRVDVTLSISAAVWSEFQQVYSQRYRPRRKHPNLPSYAKLRDGAVDSALMDYITKCKSL